MQTKTVRGTFGPRQIGREDYVKMWMSTFDQFYRLADTSAEYAELKQMAERIRIIAGTSWDGITD